MTTNVVGSFARERPPDKALDVSLWAAQLLLAALFSTLGWWKATLPLHDLARAMPPIADLPGGLIRFIGIAESAAALGLILPALTRIQPKLTAVAGLGLAALMALASGFHLLRGEAGAVGAPRILGSLAAFVAWGRAKGAPIQPYYY